MKKSILIAFAAFTSFSAAAEFRPLFNGKDLSGWTGAGYKVEDGAIVCTPEGKNLATEAVFSNYILDFEFLLSPGANNGLGIHYPGVGDGAYSGMELQILDDSAEKYKDLKDYQFHGSLYTMAPAKKGALKPVGEWNKQRVKVLGADLTVILNDQEILKENLDELRDKFPEHEGVRRRAGHIAFLGHGDKVSFRNIEILEVAPDAYTKGVESAGFKPLLGDDLDKWNYQSDGEDNWFITNGILKHTGKKGKTNDLWTKEKYKDFTMAFDWRWSAKGEMKPQPIVLADGSVKLNADGKPELVEVEELDSGIYLRGNTKSQVNLWNWTVGSGEVYGYRTDPNQSAEVKAAVTPKRKKDRPLGEWNRMLIKVSGKLLTVSLNGEVVIENAELNEMPEEGPIGLQHHGQAIDFANIWVRRD